MESLIPKRRSSALPPITKELVFEVCAGLKTQKIAVTNKNVREALGGGSLLTINPWVREWQTAQDERFRLSLTAIPDQVQASVTLMAQEMWRTTSDLASQRLVELGKRMQEVEAEHMRVIYELEEDAGKVELERDRLITDTNHFHEQIEQLRREAADLRSGLEDDRNQLRLALLRESDAERYKIMLEKELQTLRESVAKAESGKVKFEALFELEEDKASKLELELAKIRESEKILAISTATIETQFKVEKEAHTETKAKLKAVEALSTKEGFRESFKELIEEMRSKDKS